jgi:ryanodine receptor 2
MIPGVVGDTGKSDMPSGLVPNHKQSMALFLERVYGVEDRDLFFKLLEDAFLPDLRAATMLEKVNLKFCIKALLRFLE